MISFNSSVSDFDIPRPKFYKIWLHAVIKSESKTAGDIQYVFCDDEFLLEINQSFLKHDTLTDIITFPASTSDVILSGEIYISIPRVKENAIQIQTKFDDEFARVLVHGLLHLIGYKDKTALEIVEMRAKEDYYLNLQP